MVRIQRFPAVLVLLVAGCGSPTTPPATTPVAAPSLPPAPTGPLVANRDFGFWKPFPVGTKVVFKSVTTNGPNTQTSTETLTLTESTETTLTVQRQNTTERGDGSLKDVNPPESRKYAKEFGLPNGMKAEDFAKPSLKAVKKGVEKVKLLGKTYDAILYEWVDATDGGPMTVRLWECDKIPGGRIKQTMDVPQSGSKTVDVIIELATP